MYSARLLHREAGRLLDLRDLEILRKFFQPLKLNSSWALRMSPPKSSPKISFFFRDLHVSPIGPTSFSCELSLNLVNVVNAAVIQAPSTFSHQLLSAHPLIHFPAFQLRSLTVLVFVRLQQSPLSSPLTAFSTLYGRGRACLKLCLISFRSSSSKSFILDPNCFPPLALLCSLQELLQDYLSVRSPSLWQLLSKRFPDRVSS